MPTAANQSMTVRTKTGPGWPHVGVGIVVAGRRTRTDPRWPHVPSIRDGIARSRGSHQVLSDTTSGLTEGAIPGAETGLEELDRWLHGSGAYSHLLHMHPTVSYEVGRVVGALTELALDSGAIIGGGGAQGMGVGLALPEGPRPGGAGAGPGVE